MTIDLKDLLVQILGELEVSDDVNISLKTQKSLCNYEEAVVYIYDKLLKIARWKNDHRENRQLCGNKAWEVISALVKKMAESKEVKELLNER